MAKESLQSIQKRPIFRETFSDEATTRALGGVSTAVTYQNGVASCVAANSSKIVYQKNLNGIYSFRIRFTSLTPVSNSYLLDCRTSDVGAPVIQTNAGGTAINPSSGTTYVDGVATTAVSSLTKEMIFTGVTTSCINLFLNSRNSSATFGTASYELLEIYEGTLTAQEVSNLYNNRRYEQIQYKLTTPEILNIDGKNGTISNKYSGSINQTEIILNGDMSSSTGWTLGVGWSITGDKLVSNTSGTTFAFQGRGVVGKTYLMTYTITDYTSGSLILYAGTKASITRSSTGTFSEILTSAGNENLSFAGTNFIGSIDNFSVKEVIPNVVNTAVTSVNQGNVKAMDFNGATSKLDVGSYDTMLGDRTIVCWATLRSLGAGGFGRIIDNGQTVMFMGATNTINFSSNGTVNSGQSAINAVSFGRPVMIVGTRTSAGVVNIYINGVLSGTANQSSGTPVAGTTNLNIGNKSTNDRGLNGTLSGVRIINGILSVEEISQLFSSERKNYNV